ncbi:MAG: hypothetical protein GF411_11000 [Candidatus Lokiarchaeota archaeon]|nr:hypothetical protein [Candidatus Lokiarchaeota archaeon]
MMRRFASVLLVVSIMVLLAGPIRAQDSTYPTVTINFRELRMVPEDFSSLSQTAPPFSNNATLKTLLSNNDTLFWEPIGSRNATYQIDSESSTFAIVQVNSTGFYQKLVGLSPDNQSIQWIAPLSEAISNNFTNVVVEAIDFFADEGRYWGLCEEIVVLPGGLVNQEDNFVWRLTFHLIAEAQRWTLLLNSSGTLLSYQATTIPCISCCNTIPVIVFGGVILAIAILGIYALKNGAPWK